MPVPDEPADPQRQLLRERTYERLRDAIVTGVLEPGEQLRDADLSRWLGVSRTPVREGLSRLELAGLVITRPGRSTTVAPLDPRAVRDAHAVVTSMHELAVRLAVPMMSAADAEEMEQANDRFEAALEAGDVDAALEADDDLHAVPVRVAGNLAIGKVLEQFTPVLRRSERARFGTLPGRESVVLHAELIRHCRSGDADAAESVCRQIWQSLATLLTTDPPDTPPHRS